MASNDFTYSYSPGKFGEFLTKLATVGLPTKITTDYPKSIGFTSSHARGFPAVMKYVGLLDSSGAPTEAYKKGLRGGQRGRAIVGQTIRNGYRALFDVYTDADTRSDAELATFFKSNSNHDEEKVKLVVSTFKTLCRFADFDGSGAAADDDDDGGGAGEDQSGNKGNQGHRRNGGGGGHGGSSGVIINVNIALSVDATSDAAVYDAFFAAMAKHLKGLMDGSA